MSGFGDLFAEDADFVVITGRRLTGRKEIVSYHRELLESRYKGSRSQPMKVETLRFLTPNIAVAHVASGASYMENGTEFTRTGRATATLVKVEGKWHITAFHNTLTSGPGALTPSSTQSSDPTAIVHDFVKAWNSHDMEALDRLFTDDATWVPAVEVLDEGRERIVKDFSAAHATWAKTTTVALTTIPKIQMLKFDVAIVFFHMGLVDNNGNPLPGIDRAMMIVAVKQSGGWKIAAGQITKESVRSSR